MIARLERFFRYLLFVPVVASVLYIDGLLYPYLTPKTTLIRGAFILEFAMFVALLSTKRHWYVSRLSNPLSWIPGIILAWSYVASLFGVDFYHSFWSIFDRGDGLLTLTSLVGFFYLTLLYADEAFLKKLFAAIAWTASFSALFGVLQWIQWASGIDIPLLPDTSDRVSSTFGNPTFFSSYIALSLFVTLICARGLHGKWQRYAYIGAGLQALGILAGATRGTLIAIVAAGVFALLYYAWKGEHNVRLYARIGAASLLVVAALFFAFRSELARVPFAPIARLAQISVTDATVASRLFIWQNVFGEALQRPVFGVGAENIDVAFNKFYDPTQILEEWFDRTHNAFLDYLVQFGVLGLLLYLVLIAAFLREAWHLIRSQSSEKQYIGFLLFLAAIVYAIQNFFVFDTALTLWLFLTLFAAMLVWRGGISSALPIRPIPEWLSFGAGGLIALLLIPVSLFPLAANIFLAKAYLYQVYDVRHSIDDIHKGARLHTYADMEYGYQLYEWYSERQTTMLSGEARILAYRTARDILKDNYEKYPYDARTATYFAHVLDLAPKGEESEESYVREVIGHAIELSPKRIQPRYLLANVSIKKGDMAPPKSTTKRTFYEEAIQGLKEYSALVPEFSEPYYIIATLYQTLGNTQAGKEWADKGLAVYKPDLNTARRASRYYVTAEDWPNAVRFLDDLSSREPENYPVRYDLAKASYLAGDPDRAKEIVKELREKAPGLVETDANFLRAIGE